MNSVVLKQNSGTGEIASPRRRWIRPQRVSERGRKDGHSWGREGNSLSRNRRATPTFPLRAKKEKRASRKKDSNALERKLGKFDFPWDGKSDLAFKLLCKKEGIDLTSRKFRRGLSSPLYVPEKVL